MRNASSLTKPMHSVYARSILRHLVTRSSMVRTNKPNVTLIETMFVVAPKKHDNTAYSARFCFLQGTLYLETLSTILTSPTNHWIHLKLRPSTVTVMKLFTVAPNALATGPVTTTTTIKNRNVLTVSTEYLAPNSVRITRLAVRYSKLH